VHERRRSLTPLESELRPKAYREPEAPSRWERLRRRERRPPKTTAEAVVRGLIILGIAIGVASGIALLVDHFTGRAASFGFYVVGAALLAIAFVTSAGGMGARPYYAAQGSRAEREQRVSWSFSYILAGALVVLVGVLIDLF
jgi:hypothetical protein